MLSKIYFSFIFCIAVFVYSDGIKLTIIHTNDNHGRFWKNRNNEYGMAARKTLIDKIRKEVKAQGGFSLLLSGGDVNTGVPESDRQFAEPDFRGMRLLGYDAMAVGNHEFDNPLSVIYKQQEWGGFPFLSANTYSKGGKRLFKPYADFKFNNITVRVMGLTTSKTPFISTLGKSDDFYFINEIKEAEAIVPAYKKECRILIALTHIGHGKVGGGGDLALAAKVPGIDIIVGGHSEKALFKPLKQGNCNVLQAQHWGRFVGRADFVYSKGKLELKSYKLIPVNLVDSGITIPEDEEAVKLLKPYFDKDKEVLREQIATAHKDLNKPMLLQLITASLADLGKQNNPGLPVIGMTNKGGCRLSHLPKGNILFRDILSISPFTNKICQVKITFAELKKLRKFKGCVFSNYDNSMTDDSEVILITNDFLAGGGDGLPVLTGQKSYKSYNLTLADLLKKYLSKRKDLP